MEEDMIYYRILKGEDGLKEAIELIAYLHNAILKFPKFKEIDGVDLEVVEMALVGLLINNRLELNKLKKKERIKQT